MIEASKKLNFVTQDSQNVTLPSEYSSWHNRHETKIFLISVVGVIAISLYFGIKDSLNSNLQISSEILVLARDTRCCCTMGIIHIFDGTLR